MKRVDVKKAVLTMVLAGLIGIASCFAGDPANSCGDLLRQKLVESLKYPGFAKKEAIQGDVTVVFSTKDDKINVLNIISTDAALGNAIKEQISGIPCNGIPFSGFAEYKIKIHFVRK